MVKTTIGQKIGLIFLGIFLALIILESGLRTSGFAMLSLQEFENRITENKGEYRILCLGESTTAGTYVDSKGNLFSWPAQLEIMLNERSQEIKFKVFNEGRPGTQTGLILAELKDNLEKYHPNMVITMMGSNDIYPPYIVYDEDTLEIEGDSFVKNMRVYKLSNLLWLHWKEKIKELKEKMPNSTIGYFELGMNYYTLEGNREKAKEMFEKTIEAEKVFKKAIKINPQDDLAYFKLGKIYEEQGNLEEAEKVYKKAITINPKSDLIIVSLSNIYRIQNRLDEAEKLRGRVLFSNNPNTQYHYQLLYKMLDEETKLIVMQYPLRDIDKFKNMFNETQQMDIIFISNEENFKKALENANYENYFTDRFAGDFGHCTEKGNKLIAENVADTILKELKID